MSSRRPKQPLAILGVAVFVLVLLGAGCRNPLRKKPEEVLARSQDRMIDASGARIHVNLALDFDVPGTNATSERGHLSLTIDGAGSGKTPEETRGEAMITAEVATAEGSAKLVLSERAIGQVAYLQLQDVTITPKEQGAPAQVQIDAVVGAVKGMIGGKWIKLDPQEVASLAEQFGGTKVAIPTPDELRERQEQIRAALRGKPIFLVREDLGNGRVGTASAYHYRVGISRDTISTLIGTATAHLGLPSESMEEITRALQDPEIAARIDGVAGEAWVAKKGNDLLKLAFPIDIPATSGSGGKADGKLVIEFSDWGKPVNVEAPADAMTVQELLGPLLGGMLGGGPAPISPAESLDGTDAPAGAFPGAFDNNPDAIGGAGSADVDSDGLTDELEARYGSDPRQSDTDGDGFSDGQEVEGGYSPTGPGRLSQ
ncbi:hypothetical protein HY634_01610 [Candidatus Uhrbacteria bacterium]|nr:hypothetical protein [Candidatus Uhrbacteria bacterium]